MVGRIWSWLLDFAPVREAMRREVRAAVDSVMDTAEQARARQRERHRSALGRAEDERDALRTRVDELAAANAELSGANASLRGEVAELEEAARREVAEREEFAQRLVLEQEAAQARQWHGTTTDVFCCQSCWAFWFLSTTPDRTSCAVRGPYGRHDPDCTVCADPLTTLPSAKKVVFRKGTEDRVSRPAADRVAEADTDTALASAELEAIAEGLARLPKVTSRTVAWVATDLTGMPELPAKILVEIATRTTMTVPLDGVVAGIRAFTDVRTPGPGAEPIPDDSA